jgi:glycosyltransferase involved in cell wall biosynthesis
MVDSDDRLSVVIAFRQEGDEVARTVESIRKTSTPGKVDIILVNDNGEDDYDYEKVADSFGCRYIKLYKSLGPSGARCVGVRAADTENVVIMDGHMRFYDDHWNKRVCDYLKGNQNAIFCSGTTSVAEGLNDSKKNDFGAYIVLEGVPGEEYYPKWSPENLYIDQDNRELSRVPCVLGAFYAFTKNHWKNIGGLDGLSGYGFDEPYMSLKTWLFGGECYVIKDFYVGHLYRQKSTAGSLSVDFYANQLFMVDAFEEDFERRMQDLKNIKEIAGVEMYLRAKNRYRNRHAKVTPVIDYIKKKRNTEAEQRFLEINNLMKNGFVGR